MPARSALAHIHPGLPPGPVPNPEPEPTRPHPMNAPAPTTVNLVRLADATAQPWRNGGGMTRELLTWQRPDLPSSQGWSVRVSVADIARDGPFSAYPGVTRAFTVLEGEGVTLDWGGGRSRRLGPQEHAAWTAQGLHRSLDIM